MLLRTCTSKTGSGGQELLQNGLPFPSGHLVFLEFTRFVSVESELLLALSWEQCGPLGALL